MWVILNNKQGGMQENSGHGLIFYVLSQNLPGETEDKHENPDSGQPVSHP